LQTEDEGWETFTRTVEFSAAIAVILGYFFSLQQESAGIIPSYIPYLLYLVPFVEPVRRLFDRKASVKLVWIVITANAAITVLPAMLFVYVMMVAGPSLPLYPRTVASWSDIIPLVILALFYLFAYWLILRLTDTLLHSNHVLHDLFLLDIAQITKYERHHFIVNQWPWYSKLMLFLFSALPFIELLNMEVELTMPVTAGLKQGFPFLLLSTWGVIMFFAVAAADQFISKPQIAADKVRIVKFFEGEGRARLSEVIVRKIHDLDLLPEARRILNAPTVPDLQSKLTSSHVRISIENLAGSHGSDYSELRASVSANVDQTIRMKFTITLHDTITVTQEHVSLREGSYPPVIENFETFPDLTKIPAAPG